MQKIKDTLVNAGITYNDRSKTDIIFLTSSYKYSIIQDKERYFIQTATDVWNPFYDTLSEEEMILMIIKLID